MLFFVRVISGAGVALGVGLLFERFGLGTAQVIAVVVVCALAHLATYFGKAEEPDRIKFKSPGAFTAIVTVLVIVVAVIVVSVWHPSSEIAVAPEPELPSESPLTDAPASEPSEPPQSRTPAPTTQSEPSRDPAPELPLPEPSAPPSAGGAAPPPFSDAPARTPREVPELDPFCPVLVSKTDVARLDSLALRFRRDVLEHRRLFQTYLDGDTNAANGLWTFVYAAAKRGWRTVDTVQWNKYVEVAGNNKDVAMQRYLSTLDYLDGLSALWEDCSAQFKLLAARTASP